MTRHVSDAAAKMIAQFEGGQSPDGRFRPYRDAVGVWTIGYGHTHGVSSASRPLSKQEALQLLRLDLDTKYAPPVNALGLPLSQNQFDATVSAVYNLGPGILESRSSFGHELRAKHWQRAADALLLYDHAGGRQLPGLTARRKAERALFLSQPVNLKLNRWKHALAILRADAKKHGWTQAARIRARRLKDLIGKGN